MGDSPKTSFTPFLQRTNRTKTMQTSSQIPFDNNTSNNQSSSADLDELCSILTSAVSMDTCAEENITDSNTLHNNNSPSPPQTIQNQTEKLNENQPENDFSKSLLKNSENKQKLFFSQQPRKKRTFCNTLSPYSKSTVVDNDFLLSHAPQTISSSPKPSVLFKKQNYTQTSTNSQPNFIGGRTTIGFTPKHQHLQQQTTTNTFNVDDFGKSVLFEDDTNENFCGDFVGSIDNDTPRRERGKKAPILRTSLKQKNKCLFTKSTQLIEEFVPLAPSSWIEKGIIPSKEHFVDDIQLYADVLSFAQNKEKWKQKSLLNQLPFYAQPKEVTVLACTWNVNQRVFTREEVDRWTGGIQYKPDIIAVALQELEMSVDAIITGKKYSEKATQWQSLLTSSINRGKTKYTELGYFQLCGVLLYIYYKNELKNHISEVSYSSCRVGAMSGKLANKGGVAYRFKVYDSTVCFVASHLAAHQQFIEKKKSRLG
ncbi:hypothetical protein QTN25_008550 [Entamoeba marina]